MLISVNCDGGIENKGETLIVGSIIDVQVFSFSGIFARNGLPWAVGVLHVSSGTGVASKQLFIVAVAVRQLGLTCERIKPGISVRP